MRGRWLAAVAFTAFLVGPPAAGAATERPVVVAVVIDGLGGDEIAGNAPFVTSLLNGGEGARAHRYRDSRAIMIAETNPNHAAMMSGAYTNESGIPGNAFALYSDLAGEEDNEAESCVATGSVDETRLPTETSGESASCLQAETVFQAIDRYGNPDGLLTAGIFGKAKLGRIFAGRDASGSRLVDHLWAPCTPGATADEKEYCEQVPIEPVNQDRTISDGFVMDEVARVLEEGIGPERRVPDFTFVNLPNVDNAGHAFGGGGALYDTATRLADGEIKRLVEMLRSRGVWSRTVLVLLADHSHYTTLNSITLAGALEDGGIPEGSFLIVDNGSVDSLYLANRQDPERFELLRRMRELTLAENGVSEALYREANPLDGGSANTIDGRHPDWRAAGPRGPDLMVIAKPGYRFSDPSPTSNPLLGNHGGPYTRDNLFAIVGGGPFVRAADTEGLTAPDFDDTGANPNQAENVDVAATVLGLLGLPPTSGNRGRFLSEAINLDELPGLGKPTAPPEIAARRGAAVRGRDGRLRRRYQLRFGRHGDTLDLQLRRGRRWRTLYRDSSNTSYSIRLLPGRTYRFRVRNIAGSGRHSDWNQIRLRAR